MALLSVRGLAKSFADTPVVQDISFTVAPGSVTVLLGPSGCGKTTLLRLIAGLEHPDAGSVWLDGTDLADVPSHRRGFGFVFQDYALFPHRSVSENVAFGLRMAGWARERQRNRVAEALDWVGLSGLEDRAIHELSGGEQQRVALARSLAPAPRVLLLDEPLGALDRALRERLLAELRAILGQAGAAMGYGSGLTAVYVTHDQAEAFALADEIVVMRAGQIVQAGQPRDLYSHPATPFVASFLGMTNLMPAVVRSCAPPLVTTALGELRVAGCEAWKPGDEVILLLRPEAAAQATDRADLRGEVRHVSFRGRFQLATVIMADGQRLEFEFEAGERLPAPGQAIALSLDPAHLIPLSP